MYDYRTFSSHLVRQDQVKIWRPDGRGPFRGVGERRDNGPLQIEHGNDRRVESDRVPSLILATDEPIVDTHVGDDVGTIDDQQWRPSRTFNCETPPLPVVFYFALWRLRSSTCQGIEIINLDPLARRTRQVPSLNAMTAPLQHE